MKQEIEDKAMKDIENLSWEQILASNSILQVKVGIEIGKYNQNWVDLSDLVRLINKLPPILKRHKTQQDND